jgi:diguanylate cyclase (GGDEF)-like protein
MVPSSDELCFTYVAEILHTLRSTNQHEQVLHLIVDRLSRLYKAQTCAVVLIDPETEYLSVENSYGLSLTFCNAFRRSFTTAPIGKLLWTGQPIVIADASSTPGLALDVRLEHDFGSCLCTQIAVDQKTLGFLHLDRRETHQFAEADVRFVQMFADLAGLAVVKEHLIDQNLRLDRIDHETETEKYGPFLDRLRLGLERARTSREELSVMILDVDNFKHIANTYGYDTSRLILKEIGAIVRSRLHATDACGRYGFDEFIMMAANTAPDGGIRRADDLRAMVEQTAFTTRGIRSTVSIGVSFFPATAETADTLVQAAKGALFEAQRAGRNNVRWEGTVERTVPHV